MTMEKNQTAEPPLILAVDDTPHNLKLLTNLLLKEDCELELAENGQEALDAIEKNKPDLILLDVMMPVMDGYETCKRLKENPDSRDIPVIFLTAKSETEDITRAFELGAVDYVTKPFRAGELLARVKTQLELKSRREALEISNRSRRELIHILCHDLANPFYQIVTTMQLMDDDASILETMKDHLKISANNGLKTIDLVRNMEALEEGKMKLESINLTSCLRESKMMLDRRFSEKELTLEMDVDPSLNIRAERTSFVNSVTNNLLTNAIKFSPPGSKISVQAKPKNGDIFLTIRDYGIGMPESILTSLFDLSKSASRPGTSGERGTGFGMPLVKKFITAYGGDIRIRSWEKDQAEESGTEVRVTLKSA